MTHRSTPHRGSKGRTGNARSRQAGAGLVESIIIFPTLIFMTLAMLQAAMVFYARSNVNYATYEAARAATVSNASATSITAAFQKALVPYYGGGRTEAELTATVTDSLAKDLKNAAVRVEILSPSQESFKDYNSPLLQTKWKTSAAVIPNVGIDALTCPRDVPGCKSDPKTNASGQTLLDANLLKLRITYGIPPAKQMPLVGKFYTWALGKLNAAGTDAFKTALIADGRIPVVTDTVMRMQSDPIKNDWMVSSPGPGNNGSPTDPGPGPAGPSLPDCPWWDPSCVTCPDGATGKCAPGGSDTCGG